MRPSYLLPLAVLCVSFAQGQAPPQPLFDQVTSKEFLKQLIQDEVYYFISDKVAESIVVHRVDPIFPRRDMAAKVWGTVVVAFEISKEGKVRHAMAVSGPKLLKPPILAAVRQWTFQPSVLRGKPITVATSVPITISNW
jgi:outer membrane biosynthesis protein TonB